MADEENKSEQASGKKMPKKMLIIIAIVMLVEGALFGAGIMLFGESPPSVEAKGLEADSKAEQFEKIEVLLIGDKFQNTKHGVQAYLYDATIYIVVERRHQEHIESLIQSNMARISEEVTEIFARAEPVQLDEADRLTLKRQILDKCVERFGESAESEPYVKGVVISNWKRFSADL